MSRSIRVWPLFATAVLVVLYANFWMWDWDTIVFGFPINLLYHVAICLLASVTMFIVVTTAWPHDLDRE